MKLSIHLFFSALFLLSSYHIFSGDINKTHDVKRRLDFDSIVVNSDKNNKETPLHRAVRANNSRLVASLVENGANVDALDENGDRPVDIAYKNGRHDLVILMGGY